LLLAGSAAAAPPASAPADVARAVGVDERPGARVPLELALRDPDDAPRRLADVVRGDAPVLLVLGYARCEQLCSVLLPAVADAVAQVPLEAGRDYTPLVVSLDPEETPAAAGRKQAALLVRARHRGEAWRWPYLRGEAAAIERLARSVGLRYAWDPVARQWAHPAVAVVLSPEGRVSRYLYALRFDPMVLRQALLEAAAGRIGPAPAARAAEVLRCFRFDSAAQRWKARLAVYFRTGALVIFGLLFSLVVGLVVWERRRAR
jgi:protein SCO1/2